MLGTHLTMATPLQGPGSAYCTVKGASVLALCADQAGSPTPDSCPAQAHLSSKKALKLGPPKDERKPQHVKWRTFSIGIFNDKKSATSFPRSVPKGLKHSTTRSYFMHIHSSIILNDQRSTQLKCPFKIPRYWKTFLMYTVDYYTTIQFSSVAQSCPTLCDPMDCSTPSLPVYHQLLELIQTHVHQVDDAIQLSHPLSSPSPAFNLFQHQGLFK